MPGSRLLFDTNAFIAWCYEDADLARQVVFYSEPVLTLISIGELVFGALKSSQPEANRKNLNRRLQAFGILMPDRATADFYGNIRFALRNKGKPIPENDVWIAALAMQHGLPVLTRDAHFREVSGLNVIGW